MNYIKQDTTRWKVKTYLNESLQVRIVRSVAHYDSNLIKNIFKQNHFNALVIQLFSMLSLVSLGYLMDYQFFLIPAGASLLILLSILIAVIGAVTYWFNEWRVTVIILLLIIINFLTSFDFLRRNNVAFGLNYDEKKPTYSHAAIRSLFNKEQVEKDKQNTIQILNNWRDSISHQPSMGKPKMIILSTSGGGIKISLMDG